MTNQQVPEALRLAEQYDYGDPVAHSNMWKAAVCTELRRQHARIAELEAQLEAVGAGGVQALSAAPVTPNGDKLRRIANLVRTSASDGASPTEYVLAGWKAAMLAASPTPPAKQQVITPETGNSVSAQGAAITSESGAVYAELPDFDSGDEPIWEAVFNWKAATPGSDAHKKADAVSGAVINALRDFADRTHALRMEQAAPEAAPVKACVCGEPQASGTVHRVDGPCYVAAPQQDAQEPSQRETVDVVGVRSNGEHVNLGKIAMPPRMKAREIAIEQFGSFKDDDGSDAEMCFGALEYFLEWLIQQGWSKAPQPAPAPLSDDVVKDAARWRWLSEHIGVAWNEGKFTSLVRIVSDKNRTALNASIDRMMAGDWSDAAIAAQGGKE